MVLYNRMNNFLFVVDYNIIVFYCRAHVTTVYTALYVEICLYMSAKLSGQSVIFACPPLRIDDAYNYRMLLAHVHGSLFMCNTIILYECYDLYQSV